MPLRFAIGIDAGSAQTKAVLLDSISLALLAKASLPTGWNPKASAEAVLAKLWQGFGEAQACSIVATGYGRVAIPFADKNITEISCHAKGAVHCFPTARLVIDIGGQDSKVISLAEGGAVRDFLMNDKCAAGTGRFVESVARLLGLHIAEFCALASGGEACAITSMCAVFAETEIIGLLAQGAKPGAIAQGVLASIARRMQGLAARLPGTGDCVFSGGLAQSPVCAERLAQELGCPVLVPEYPQFTGALGAALEAARLAKEKNA
ncbi:MAG: 2-hydroxyglutaryl-CoA dehydratase [Desulfovibrio sp.]|nr:2-hydroxyglutaryl-CoA dehydratase [Desulfovibrio sp.]